VRYSTFGEHKSAIVERFNRTLKENMWKRFTAENTRNWIDMLDDLLNTYNDKYHSSIGTTPTEASAIKNIAKVINNGRYISVKSNHKFRVGDSVRISRTKQVFEKGYLPNWSEEVFTVHEVKETTPVTYKLKDFSGTILDGSFYNEELQKTNNEIYRIEKIIRKKVINGVQHGLVKWMGYNERHNQWIPLSGLTKL